MAVLVTKGDQVLLLKRRGSHGVGTWCPPGGHLEFGERPEHRAVLEAKEETGVDVTDVRFLSITNDVFPEGKHYITIWMEATPLAGEPAIASEREVADVGWFTWDALPHPLFLSFAHLVEGTSYPAFDLWERHRKRDDASPGQADTPRDTTRANVVDRASRRRLAELLRHFVAGLVSNDEFEDRYPRRSHDPAVRQILDEGAWFLYDDVHEHRLTGPHELNATDRENVERWILFLQTDLSYEWPHRAARYSLGARAAEPGDAGLTGANRPTICITWRPG